MDGHNSQEMNIPYSKPTLGQEEIDAVTKVLQSGWLAAGRETGAFEEEFSDYISPPGEHYYCIYTNSCTSALKMGFKYFLEQGYIEYRLLTPNTFCATYSAAEEMGMTEYQEGRCVRNEPIDLLFIDDSHIYVVTHYGGEKCNFPTDIEDSAHRIEPNDPLVGKIRCYSFYATKNMTTGSGGMFVTNDKDIYERARLFWRDGLTTSTADRMAGFMGYRVQAMAGGYDGNDIGAAIGRVQLRKLPEFTKRRNEICGHYNAAFNLDWKGNHLYPYFVKDEAEVYKCIAWLKEKGIGCSHNYPNTGWNGVSLPIYPLMTDEEVQYVIDNVLKYELRSK